MISLKVHHDHPSVSGWSRFVEDLLQCCVIHCCIQCKAASRGQYPWLKTYAKMNLLDIYLKCMQWLGHHPFDLHNILQKMNREAVVQIVLATFKRTLQEIQENDQINLWCKYLPRTAISRPRWRWLARLHWVSSISLLLKERSWTSFTPSRLSSVGPATGTVAPMATHT